MNQEEINNFNDDAYFQGNDLSKFKENILLVLKEMETKLESKYAKMEEDTGLKLLEYENKLHAQDIRLRELTSSFNQDKVKIDKVDGLLIFQRKTNDALTSHDIKLNSLAKDLASSCNKYDKMYLDNLIIPGTIGDYCKFKNLREYIEHNMTQVANLNTAREKHQIDLKSYKDKLELIIQQFNLQINNYEKNSRDYTNARLGEIEASFRQQIQDMHVRMNDMRMENSKYAAQLKHEASKIEIEYDRLVNMRNEISEELKKAVNEMKEANLSTQMSFGEFKIEFERIKFRFTEIAEFIKDVRFRRNIGGDVTRQEMKKMSERLTFEKKKHHRRSDNELQSIDTYMDKIIANLDGDPNPPNVKKEKKTDEGRTLDEEPNDTKNSKVLEVDDDDEGFTSSDNNINNGLNFNNNEVLDDNNTDITPNYLDNQIKSKPENNIERKGKRTRTFGHTTSLFRKQTGTVFPSNDNCTKKKEVFPDRKLNEIEHFTKKKLEELANQIKMYIPINFNAYLKDDASKVVYAIDANKKEYENLRQSNTVEPSVAMPRGKERTNQVNQPHLLSQVSQINLMNQVNVMNGAALTSYPLFTGNTRKKSSNVIQSTRSMKVLEENEGKQRRQSEKPKMRSPTKNNTTHVRNYMPLSELMLRDKYVDDSNVIKNISSNLFMPLRQNFDQYEILDSRNLYEDK